MHKILDLFGYPRVSDAGKPMSICERLTHKLWTDNPAYGELDAQLDAKRDKGGRDSNPP